MERKIEKIFLDKGFGFPVCLVNVPMIKVRGEWTPDINYNKLEAIVLELLCSKPSRLTGNEIHFIRLHFEMTLKQFAGRFDVTHPAVLKWENRGNRPTSINWSTEKDIRLFILSRLKKSANAFVSIYAQLENKLSAKSQPIEVDAEKLSA